MPCIRFIFQSRLNHLDMRIESVGSFLPDEKLLEARRLHELGAIDSASLTAMEDAAVSDIVERQIAFPLQFVTSGELRRSHWANDFWTALEGIAAEPADADPLFCPLPGGGDHLYLTGRVAFNPSHPFFDDFRFLHRAVGGRATCRQTLPSPAALLIELIEGWSPGESRLYDSLDALAADIVEAYRATVATLCGMGCGSIQFDDTALGHMCDPTFATRLLLGGIDPRELGERLIDVINRSFDAVPRGVERSIYISGSDTKFPAWHNDSIAGSLICEALARLDADKFFLPFNPGDEASLDVLANIPRGREVVLGLMDAHTPHLDDAAELTAMADKASAFVSPDALSVSAMTGFKLSSYGNRGLTADDQWIKLRELHSIFNR